MCYRTTRLYASQSIKRQSRACNRTRKISINSLHDYLTSEYIDDVIRCWTLKTDLLILNSRLDLVLVWVFWLRNMWNTNVWLFQFRYLKLVMRIARLKSNMFLLGASGLEDIQLAWSSDGTFSNTKSLLQIQSHLLSQPVLFTNANNWDTCQFAFNQFSNYNQLV